MLYLDASALVKLVVPESESAALLARIDGEQVCSIDLASVEVVRAARRRHGDRGTERANATMEHVAHLAVDADVRGIAAAVDPVELRSLDALHLAAAVRIAEDLDAFICYDQRLCAAARQCGLTVESPGAE